MSPFTNYAWIIGIQFYIYMFMYLSLMTEYLVDFFLLFLLKESCYPPSLSCYLVLSFCLVLSYLININFQNRSKVESELSNPCG